LGMDCHSRIHLCHRLFLADVPLQCDICRAHNHQPGGYYAPWRASGSRHNVLDCKLERPQHMLDLGPRKGPGFVMASAFGGRSSTSYADMCISSSACRVHQYVVRST
jgi:hypothetical protein